MRRFELSIHPQAMPEHIGVGMYDDVVRRGTRTLLRKHKGDTRDQVLIFTFTPTVISSLILTSQFRTLSHTNYYRYLSSLNLPLHSILLTMARK